MKTTFILFCFFLLSNTILGAYSLNYPTGDSLTVKDSIDQNKFPDLESIWGFRIGYFPIYGDYLETSGISGTFYNENAISKYFNLGWSFQLNKALGSDGGFMSLSSYLSYPFFAGDQKFFIKGGLGLATLGYINPVAMFEVEYLIWEFEKSAISISISECIPEFKNLMPPVISIGILF